MAQVVEYLPIKHNVIGSNPSTAKEKKKRETKSDCFITIHLMDRQRMLTRNKRKQILLHVLCCFCPWYFCMSLTAHSLELCSELVFSSLSLSVRL
jgi:hypothetical protein